MINGPHHSSNPQVGNALQSNNKSDGHGSRSQKQAGSTAESHVQAQPVSLSQEAKMMQQVEQKLSDHSDINQHKVTEIKQRIDSGSFKVDSEQVASKMMGFDGFF